MGHHDQSGHVCLAVQQPEKAGFPTTPTGGVGSLPLVVPQRSGALALLAAWQGQGVASGIESRTKKKLMS